MTQHEFIDKLRTGLKRLPAARRNEILDDIQNHFFEGLADGASEQQLCEMLGDPDTLAKEYIATHAIEAATENPTPRTVFRAVWSGLGVAFLNLFFMFWVWLAAGCVWVMVALAALTCSLGGVFAVVVSVIKLIDPLFSVYVDYPVIYIVGGVAATAFGILCVIFTIWLGKKLAKGMVGYAKLNVDIVTGRRRRNEQN